MSATGRLRSLNRQTRLLPSVTRFRLFRAARQQRLVAHPRWRRRQRWTSTHSAEKTQRPDTYPSPLRNLEKIATLSSRPRPGFRQIRIAQNQHARMQLRRHLPTDLFRLDQLYPLALPSSITKTSTSPSSTVHRPLLPNPLLLLPSPAGLWQDSQSGAATLLEGTKTLFRG